MQLSTILAAKGSEVATISPHATVSDLVERLGTLGVGALVVSHDGASIAGIVSERDIVRGLAHGPQTLTDLVTTIMTARVYTASPDTPVDVLMHLMTDHRIRHVPVTDDEGALVGIVSIGDIVKSRLGELEAERAALLEYISQ